MIFFEWKVFFCANKFYLNLFSICKISFVSLWKKEQRNITSCQLWSIPFYCHCQQVHYWCDRGKDTGILCSFAGTTIYIKTSCKVMNHVHRCRNKQQKKVSDLKLKETKVNEFEISTYDRALMSFAKHSYIISKFIWHFFYSLLIQSILVWE